MRNMLVLILAGAMVPTLSAQLVDTRTDVDPGGASVNGVLDANEYGAGNAYSYTGGGGGFNGAVSNGTLYMNSDLSDLYIGFDPGADLNDNVILYLDTVAGGQFDDVNMNDTGDNGRRLSSNLVPDVLDTFPVGMDYSVVIGSFGIVVFELTSGSTPNHLGFVKFDGTFTGNDPNLIREISIPLGDLGLVGGVASEVNFLAAYGSDTSFIADEAIPAQPFSGVANPGFNNNGTFQPLDWPNYNKFVTTPEPTTLGLMLVGALGLLRRRR